MFWVTILLTNSQSMKPSRQTPASQQKSKENLALNKPGSQTSGYTPHASAKSHKIPNSCNIKYRDISFINDNILLIP